MKILLPAMPQLYIYSRGIAKVTNYFFLSNIGDKSKTGVQASNPAICRNVIFTLNSFFISPATGEAVLSERNEISYTTIAINKSGISQNPIEKGTCNTWDKPSIKGLPKIGHPSKICTSK